MKMVLYKCTTLPLPLVRFLIPFGSSKQSERTSKLRSRKSVKHTACLYLCKEANCSIEDNESLVQHIPIPEYCQSNAPQNIFVKTSSILSLIGKLSETRITNCQCCTLQDNSVLFQKSASFICSKTSIFGLLIKKRLPLMMMMVMVMVMVMMMMIAIMQMY